MKEDLYKKYLKNIRDGKTAIRKEYVDDGYFSYYTKREIYNKLNSKRIIIDGVNEYFDHFIDKTIESILNNNNYYQEIHIGKVGHNLSDKIKDANSNESDIYGYNISISTNEIRHAINRHGIESERFRGQKMLNAGEIKLLPYILINVDEIRFLGKNKNKQNVYNLISKNVDGTYNLLQFVNNSRHNFGFQSLYINIKKH